MLRVRKYSPFVALSFGVFHNRLDGAHCLVSIASHCVNNNANTLRYRFMKEKAALPRAQPRFVLASGHQLFLAGFNS